MKPKKIFTAWDKREERFREDVVISSDGVAHIVRSTPEFNKMVNDWYKGKGDVLGGDYGEIDYTDWYCANNVEIKYL